MPYSLHRQLIRRFAPERLHPSRRDFLRSLSLGTAAGLLGGCAAPRPSPSQPRVVIVGAGFAGLACAHELEAAGFTVTLLEARRRTGGRVMTWRDFVPGKTIEGGAELIGSNHPLWQGYAARFGLTMRPLSDDDIPASILFEGRRLTDIEARELFEAMDAVFATMTREASAVNAHEPWTTPEATALDTLSLAARLDRFPVGALARRAVDVQLASDNAVDCARQSYLANLALIRGGGLEDFWTQSEVYRCQQGNDALAREFTRRLRPRTLHAGTSVARIEQHDDRMRVITRGGSGLEADHVVLAVPPSVWGRIEFDPVLPEDLTPQMGSAVKYFARVRLPFWRSQGGSPNGLSDGAVSQTWEGTDQQPGEGTALVGFSGGSAAERSREGWRARTPSLHAREMEALHPGFSGHLEGQRFMDWVGDPWAGGGYAFPAPGELTRVGPRLRQGLKRLHFAGEHTCPAFVGYMEGALQSGVRVARALGAGALAGREATKTPLPRSSFERG